MECLDLSFEVIDESNSTAQYTRICSGARSDCCTRVCTRVDNEDQNSSIDAWEKYLEINAGVLQY